MGYTVTEKEIIDYQTGEVLSGIRVKQSRVEYYFTQVNDLVASELQHITGQEYKLTTLLSMYVDKETNSYLLDKSRQRSICTNLNIELKTFYNMISRLRKRGWIIKHNDVWIMNPDYIWRGGQRQREVLLSDIRNRRLESII